MNTSEVLQNVLDERHRQDKKWGEQNHTISVYGHIVGEEFGEVSKAIVEILMDEVMYSTMNHELRVELRKELIQAAATAVAMVECMDRNRYTLAQ